MIYCLHRSSWQNSVPASHGASWSRCQRCSPAVLSLRAHSPGQRRSRWAGRSSCGIAAGQRPPNPVTRGHHSARLVPHGWGGSLPFCYRVQILYGLYKTRRIIKLNEIWSSVHCLLHFCRLATIFFSVGNAALIVLLFEWHAAIDWELTILPHTWRCGKRNFPPIPSHLWQLLVPHWE